MTLPDGYTPVPAGKLAAIVTSLEMFERPAPRPERNDAGWEIERTERPDIDRYRALYRRVGEDWLWFSRLAMTDAKLAACIRDPAVEVHMLRLNGIDEGIAELDFRKPGECELLFFGVSAALVGSGAGRWLMNRAITRAWSKPIRRFWVHTCTMDHQGAVAFYMRSGFVPFRREIEIVDDPRLDGRFPIDVAPHVPLIPVQS